MVVLALMCCNPNIVLDMHETSSDNYEAMLATKLLRVGDQRVAFLLANSRGIMALPVVSVTSYFKDVDTLIDKPHETTTAGLQRWPYGARGSYTANLSFDREGYWLLDIKISEEDRVGEVQLFVEVSDGYGVLDVGQTAPRSLNKVMDNVDMPNELTTSSHPVPELYDMTIADAVINGKPTVIVFASPMFCTSATCGPQVETVAQLSASYQGSANFIHIEVYENPHEILGDLNQAEVSPVVVEWGLTTFPGWTNESWVFLVGDDGLVKARFEGYTAFDELRSALEAELN